jgi:hypothetical protein
MTTWAERSQILRDNIIKRIDEYLESNKLPYKSEIFSMDFIWIKPIDHGGEYKFVSIIICWWTGDAEIAVVHQVNNDTEYKFITDQYLVFYNDTSQIPNDRDEEHGTRDGTIKYYPSPFYEREDEIVSDAMSILDELFKTETRPFPGDMLSSEKLTKFGDQWVISKATDKFPTQEEIKMNAAEMGVGTIPFNTSGLLNVEPKIIYSKEEADLVAKYGLYSVTGPEIVEYIADENTGPVSGCMSQSMYERLSGSKIIGRKGNKGVVSILTPDQIMPYNGLERAEIVLSPRQIYDRVGDVHGIYYSALTEVGYMRVEYIHESFFAEFPGVVVIVKNKNNTRKEKRILRRASRRLCMEAKKVVYSILTPRGYCVEGPSIHDVDDI